MEKKKKTGSIIKKCIFSIISICILAVILLLVRYAITGSVFFGVKSQRDVEALEKMIKELNQKGAHLETDIDNKEVYTWNEVSGELESINWEREGIIADKLSFGVFRGLKVLKLNNEFPIVGDLDQNQITEIVVNKNRKLKELYCEMLDLKQLDLTQNKELVEVCCAYNRLKKLDVSKNTKLKRLECSNNEITELKLGNNTKLTELYCEKLDLTQLDLTQNKELVEVCCGYNKIKKLDVSKNTKLKQLECSNNEITELKLGNNTKLKEIYCDEKAVLQGVTKTAKIITEERIIVPEEEQKIVDEIMEEYKKRFSPEYAQVIDFEEIERDLKYLKTLYPDCTYEELWNKMLEVGSEEEADELFGGE